MSPAEMHIRRVKGLCYTCDEKISFNHRCPNKHLMIQQIDEDHTSDFDTEHEPEPPDPTLNNLGHHLSYNTLKGANAVGTMKFQGQVNGVNLQILLDSGSSDNFIQPRLAQFLKLTIEPAPQFKVLAGNGHSMVAEGFIQNL